MCQEDPQLAAQPPEKPEYQMRRKGRDYASPLRTWRGRKFGSQYLVLLFLCVVCASKIKQNQTEKNKILKN